MSGEDATMKGSNKDSNEYAKLQELHNKHISAQITSLSEHSVKTSDRLTEHSITMSDNISKLTNIMTKAEERHGAQKETTNRLEENQREQGKELKEFKEKANDEINTLATQVLLLDKDVVNKAQRLEKEVADNAKPWNTAKTIVSTVIGAVLTAGAVALFAL